MAHELPPLNVLGGPARDTLIRLMVEGYAVEARQPQLNLPELWIIDLTVVPCQLNHRLAASEAMFGRIFG